MKLERRMRCQCSRGRCRYTVRLDGRSARQVRRQEATEVATDGQYVYLGPAPRVGPTIAGTVLWTAAVFFDVGETIVDETREYGTWADWLGVPRHTFSAVFGAVIARGGDYRETFQQ